MFALIKKLKRLTECQISFLLVHVQRLIFPIEKNQSSKPFLELNRKIKKQDNDEKRQKEIL